MPPISCLLPTNLDTLYLVPRVENMNRERLRQKRINASIKTSRRADVD